ncbi:hypothetical protein CK203_000086 [Vitis vinifera]|uniref:Uncharacterized protein n=1 Tax=Vitis vinifera TaxID=29760 RepID=A0A438KRK3_VITVI|nr:hypothetical protein CK203_000086 [Vitis vinifera]
MLKVSVERKPSWLGLKASPVENGARLQSTIGSVFALSFEKEESEKKNREDEALFQLGGGREQCLVEKVVTKRKFKVVGKFRGGWIELWGLPFHLWSEEHLKKIVEQWGTMTEIDWQTLKLYDLCKVRMRILMKERSVLPALIEVLDGGWVFTISVAVVRVEDVRRDKEIGWASLGGRDKAYSIDEEGHRASNSMQREGLNLLLIPTMVETDLGWRGEGSSAMGNGKLVLEVSDAQPKGSVMKFGSKKLWTTLFLHVLDADWGSKSKRPSNA